MTDKKIHMCPLFADQPCPQGKEASDACSVRVNGDYNPITDFKDLLVMHCAIHRANENKENSSI